MMENLRKYVEAGMGALTSERAQQLARALVKQGQAGKDQASRIAGEMVEWSKTNRERLAELVRREVKKQLDGLGVATKRDIDSLKTRLSRLEKSRGPATARKETAPTGAARKGTARTGTGATGAGATGTRQGTRRGGGASRGS